MKRRWLLFVMKRPWRFVGVVAVAVACFGLVMQAAHIGSINMWMTVSLTGFAVTIVAVVLDSPGQRRRVLLYFIPAMLLCVAAVLSATHAIS